MSSLDDRYGTRARPRWLWWVVAAVGIGVGVAWAAWIALQDRPVTAQLWGYDVVDDDTTVLTIELVRPEPVPVECSVYVQGVDHAITGERTVRFDAGTSERERVTVEVETTERGVTGAIRSCSALD